jgi:hypothetical protein
MHTMLGLAPGSGAPNLLFRPFFAGEAEPVHLMSDIAPAKWIEVCFQSVKNKKFLPQPPWTDLRWS